MALVYLRAKRLKEAEKTFKVAMKYNDKDPLIWLNLGVLYEFQGKFKDAFKMVEMAVELTPLNSPHHKATMKKFSDLKKKVK